MKPFKAALWISVVLAFLTANASAQTAQLTGLVTDPSGTFVPGANVMARNVETNIETPSATNEQGYYTIPNLNPGVYDVSVQKSGFRTIARTGIQLNVAQVARMDFDLQIGEVRETVTIAAEAPILTTERATIGQVIGSKKILDLPLNGRDFTQLSTLVPGAISRGTESQTQAPLISVNGSRNSKTVFMIDGGSVTSQYFDSASIVPSVDAIQEFTVQSNSFSAEYGQGTAVINVSLRSGTNQVHGSAYEFLRNQVLDARNFFNTTGVRPPVKQNQFGFTLGGPVVLPHLYHGKDRTFIFGDYEGTRLRRASTFNTAVPSVAMRSGDFSSLRTPLLDPLTRAPFPGNVIPADRISPQAAFFLPFYPTANTGLGTFNYAPTRRSDGDKFDVRMDHHFSTADVLSGSYSLNDIEVYTPGSFAANGAVTQQNRRQRAGASETHSFSASMLNEFRLNYVRVRYQNEPQGLGTNYTVQSGIGGFAEQSAN